MPLEYSYLVASVILYGVMIMVQAVGSNLAQNLGDLAGPRDGLGDDGVFEGRCKRANANMVEALFLFAPLVLVAGATDRFNDMTQLGAGLFLGARLIYAPLYWFGVPWLRTLAWFVGAVGSAIVLFQVLPFSGVA